MSNDPAVNATLLNLCARVQGGPAPTPSPSASPAEATPAAHTAADYAWLRQALASVEAPERRVKLLLDRLDAGGLDADAVLDVLEELSDLVEDVNWATEFALMDGPARIVAHLRREGGAEAQAGLARVVAHSAQLHAPVQEAYARAGALPVLLSGIAAQPDPGTTAALLHACSCLCRENDPNTILFLQNGGMDILAALLRRAGQSDEAPVTPKIVARVFFLLSYLADKGVCTEELIGRLAALVEARHDAAHSDGGAADAVETAGAHALLALLRKSPTVVKEVVRQGMPSTMQAWRLLRDEDDPRAQFARELDRVS